MVNLSDSGRIVGSKINQYVFCSLSYMRYVLIKIWLCIVRKFWLTRRKYDWSKYDCAEVEEDPDHSPVNFRAWEDLTQHKSTGGLRIRNLELVNMSLLRNNAWRMVNQQDTFLSSVLKAKYFPNATFSTAPIHLPKSAFWRSILSIKPAFS